MAKDEGQPSSCCTDLAMPQDSEFLMVQHSQARNLAASADNDPSISAPTINSEHRTIESTMVDWVKGKERERDVVATKRKTKKKPVELLDLPVDVLREIINQLPHTNDLTSLALCHSILHNLTIPCIYSRFDIVWPDTNTQAEPRTGVDALTYGLATLVMHEEVFGEAAWQRRQRYQRGDTLDSTSRQSIRRRRRGNYYAQYTKKFSLGNGPREYVDDYLITKEGGKMLGTLVALAVARMRNLETFVWDMPTGVLRDVWLALSSLEDRDDGEDCRLERVWIRWHDNAQLDLMSGVPAPPVPHVNIGAHNPIHNNAPTAASLSFAMAAQSGLYTQHQIVDRVEHPTFSVLPPLKSLSVLDIDELPYLDELSILLARSKHKLRELRVGIAVQAEERDWAQVWEGDTLQQVDYSSTSTLISNISECRLGGVLGILFGRFFNMSNNSSTQLPLGSRSIASASFDEAVPHTRSPSLVNSFDLPSAHTSPGDLAGSSDIFTDALSEPLPEQTSFDTVTPSLPALFPSTQSPFTLLQSTPHTPKSIPLRSVRHSSREARLRGPFLDGKLRLETLELERVPLCVNILQRAIDWPILTSLTLINCPNHEQLWKTLRHIYSPMKPSKTATPAATPSPSPRRRSMNIRPQEYSLNLKKIHTNNASLSLINFIKDALAPNSLEVLFLQGSRLFSSTIVPIEAIYKGILRRHRSSLKKLLIECSDPRTPTNTDPFITSNRWRKWIMNREILTFITSGKMPSLRELGFVADYKDWHFFLQRLPFIPHIRSIYVPHVADHPHAQSGCDPLELALQIVDIVSLRLDIELCYIGIGNKCFEILETKATRPTDTVSPSGAGNETAGTAHVDGETESAWLHEPHTTVNLPGQGNDVHDLLIMDEEEDEVEDEDPEIDPINPLQDTDEVTQSESDENFDDSFDSEEDDEDWGYGRKDKGDFGPRLRLREILFYDDKVAVFKARHGKL